MYIMGGVIGQSVGLDYNFGQGIGFAHTFFQLRPKEIAAISCRAQQNGISRCWRRLGKQVQQIVPLFKSFSYLCDKHVFTKMINYE